VNLAGTPATPEQIAAAEAGVEQAFALAELARQRLQAATITAPIDGVVTDLQVAQGTTVGPTGPILTLMPPELQIPVLVDESQAPFLELGQAVAVSVESMPQDAFSGVVKSIAPVLDPRTHTLAVKIEVGDPRGRLKPGMFAQLSIQTSQRQGVVVVPKEAVTRLSSTDSGPVQYAVFVVSENRVKRTRVVLGASDSKNVEVSQGLVEGLDVVLSPRSDLLDGELITPPS
jgi:RND family efflux transporter MFP subunit